MLTHEEVLHAFPGTPVLVFRGEFPPSLVHQETREVLSGAGVPLIVSELVTFDSELDHEIATTIMPVQSKDE
ncbi:MAG: hypothetical protein WCG47_16025, partial [Dermatophilaceae bacterium]